MYELALVIANGSVFLVEVLLSARLGREGQDGYAHGLEMDIGELAEAYGFVVPYDVLLYGEVDGDVEGEDEADEDVELLGE
jgi:hypothetical protein